MSNSGPGVSAADKQRRTAELTTQIEQLERREEFLIKEAVSGGQELSRPRTPGRRLNNSPTVIQ